MSEMSVTDNQRMICMNLVAALSTAALAGSRVKCHELMLKKSSKTFAMFLTLIWLRFFPILHCADF